MNAARSLLLLALAASPGLAVAQQPEPAAAPPAAATPASQAPAARPSASSERERAVSPELASRISEAMPRYNPPPPPSEPTEEEVEASQPRNRIIRLPRVIVEGERPPVFTDRELHTNEGLAELAISRYLSELDRGLNRYTLPLFGQSQEQRALQEMADQERLRHLRKNEERATLIRASEGAEAAEEFRDITQDALMRRSNLPEPSSMRRRD